ncbi:uncharacterized protein LOC135274890 [Aotus nancymaae]|uniref:uncharacterized protein LOC135274890 n=1 Tax=Aotus nancymaae TaxID=37293 RepID=UPI0030FEE501
MINNDGWNLATSRNSMKASVAKTWPQQQWQLQGSPPVYPDTLAVQVQPAVPARAPASQGSPPLYADSSCGQVQPAVPARAPASQGSPPLYADSSAGQDHPAVPARAPPRGALYFHQFFLTPEPGLQLCIAVSCNILSDERRDPPPLVLRHPTRKTPHNFADSRSTVGIPPVKDGVPNTELRAEEEPMDIDDQELGPSSILRGPNNPAPAVLPGPVPGCSHWQKDHLSNTSDTTMEWEDTQPKDAAAPAVGSCSLPAAGSHSLRLVPPQEWRWERDVGPLPAKRPRKSLERFRGTTGGCRRTTSRRLKK